MSQADLKSWDDLYPGRFLHAVDLAGKRPVVEIERVYYDTELTSQRDPKGKVVLKFKGYPKELALNATQRRCLIAMFGTDPQAAVGKRIVLCEGRAPNPALGNKEGPCVRFYGSPDIAHDIDLVVVVRRGVIAGVTMVAVKQPAAPAAPAPAQRPAQQPQRPAPSAQPPLSDAEVLDLQRRINEAGDPAEVDDLRKEAGRLRTRMTTEHQAVIRAAFEAADERCGGPPP